MSDPRKPPCQKGKDGNESDTIVVWFNEKCPSNCPESPPAGKFAYIVSRNVSLDGDLLSQVEWLEDYIQPHSHERALSALKRLNRLANHEGKAFRSVIRYHGYEPWWFHQEWMFQRFLLPYTRYAALLSRLRGARRIVVHKCPQDLALLLESLFPVWMKGVEFCCGRKRPMRKVAGFLKRLAAGFYYRLVTFLSLVVAVWTRPRALIYTIDIVSPLKSIDGRIENLYRRLQEQGVSFLEIAWSVDFGRAARNLFARKRLPIYMQGIFPWAQANSPIIAAQTVAARSSLEDQLLEQVAVKLLLRKSMYSVLVIKRLESILKVLRPRCAFFIDDHRHAYELVVACKRLRIPTLAVQHGQINRFSVGLMAYGFDAPSRHAFDRYCLWSPFFVEQVLKQSELYSSSNVFAGGPPRSFRADSAALEIAKVNGKRVRALFICEQYDSLVQEREVVPYLRQAASDSRLQVSLKLHPSQKEIPFLVGEDDALKTIKILRGPIEQSMDKADVIVASYSSAIFEAILYEKPVVLFSTTLYDDPHGIVEAGLATKVSEPGEIADALLQVLDVSPDVLKKRREIVWGRETLDGAAAVVDEMSTILCANV